MNAPPTMSVGRHRKVVSSPFTGWDFSTQVPASVLVPGPSPPHCLCAILNRWRWGSPLTAFRADNSYRTFAGGLHLELSLDRARRHCRSERPLLHQQSDCPRFLVRVSLWHTDPQPYRQPPPRILCHLLHRTRAARPTLAAAGRRRLLRLLHNFLAPT